MPTAVWRRDDSRWAFASFDSYEVTTVRRCVLVRGQKIDAVDFGGACAMDLESPDGLMLVGIDIEHDVTAWLSEGAEVLWDSAKDLAVGGAS